MKAVLIFRRRAPVTEDSFVELVAWRLPRPLEGSSHNFKYRFAYVVKDLCVLRYDNERGKDGHKHVGPVEHPYILSSLDALIADFTTDVEGIEP